MAERNEKMTREEALELLRGGEEGIRKWNATRPAEIDLREAELNKADLTHADLYGADLSDADLGGVCLIQADLRNAVLGGAFLKYADLRWADLRNADLSRAWLHGTIFSKADIANVDFSQAAMHDTVFSNHLSGAVGLADVHHHGPCSIDTLTLTLSNGCLPETFLRGCGLSPWEIQLAKLYDDTLHPGEITEIFTTKILPARSGDAINLGGIFISYSWDDKAFVDKLYRRLYDAGASVWLDRHDLVAGDMQKQIGRALRTQDVVLVVLSESSIESDWVEHELETARKKEKDEGRDVLCPVALDGSWSKKANSDVLWRQLKKKLVLDFSAWKTKKFEGTFDKLVKGLQINYP